MSDPAIHLHDLTFGWTPSQPVIDIPEFIVPAGQATFLEGPSGSGKSTLLSILAGIIKPQTGTVTVLGETLNNMDEAARDAFRADRIGVIFQLFNLLPYLSITENVLLPCQFSPARALRAGTTLGARKKAAHDLLDRLGLSALAKGKRQVTNLSVGQQQRVAAARALIGSPELIIADEPTSALDTANRGAFIETLLTEVRKSGATLLFVSHDLGLAEYFDRTLKLDEINQARAEAS